jgi:hypothetical protein
VVKSINFLTYLTKVSDLGLKIMANGRGVLLKGKK